MVRYPAPRIPASRIGGIRFGRRADGRRDLIGLSPVPSITTIVIRRRTADLTSSRAPSPPPARMATIGSEPATAAAIPKSRCRSPPQSALLARTKAE